MQVKIKNHPAIQNNLVVSYFSFYTFASALTKNVSLFSFHATSFFFLIIHFRLYYPTNTVNASINPHLSKDAPAFMPGSVLLSYHFFIKKFFLSLYWRCRCTLWFCCNLLYWLWFCCLILCSLFLFLCH